MKPTSNETPLLDTVKDPKDLREFNIDQLKQLADELRAETVSAVSVTGGHLGAGLGVVELTLAIHKVFDTPGERAGTTKAHVPAHPVRFLRVHGRIPSTATCRSDRPPR